MIPQHIKNIIFDFGAVIFDIDGSKTIKSFRDMNITQFDSFHDFLISHKNEALFMDIEIGAISPNQFRDTIRSWAKSPITDAQIDNAWNAMLVGYVPERLDLLQELRSKYRTFLLSNTNIIHWQYFTDLLKPYGFNGLHELFEKEYYSHTVGMRKPNFDIFKYVLKDAELFAGETLFLDDNLKNVEAARMLGIPSIQITPELDILTVFGKR